MKQHGLDMKGKKLTYVCIKPTGNYECLKCKKELSKNEEHVTALLDCSERPINNEPNRVYVYKLCNECFESIKKIPNWLSILEDDIEMALQNLPRFKFGDGLSQQEKDRLHRRILFGKEDA